MADSLFRAVTDRLHSIARLRRIAKRCARNLVLTQPFHGGRIAFNAVTHARARTGGRSYETIDRQIQDRLLERTASRRRFLDLGANVGGMTLALPPGSAAVVDFCPHSYSSMGDPAGNLARIRAVPGLGVFRLGAGDLGVRSYRDFTRGEIHWP